MRINRDEIEKLLVGRWAIASIFLVWTLTQLFFLSRGVKTAVDSEIYINDAKTILAGGSLSGIDFWHSGYSYFLAAIFLVGGNLLAVVVVQIILSGLALFALFSLVSRLISDQRAAILASLLFVIWFKIHEWNTFIYTESLFTSCVLLSLLAISRCVKLWHYIVCLPLISFTFLIRPTGIGFLAGIVAYAIYEVYTRLEKSKSWFYIGSTCIVVLFLYILQVELTDYVPSIIDSYSKGEIIYPNITLWITVPDDLWLPKENTNPFVGLIYFVWNNPLYFVKLFSIKILLFFGNIKPYFSWQHIVFIVLVLFPIYYLAVLGFKKLPPCGEKYCMIVFIFFQALTVAFTSENWDGRFLIPVLPLIFVLAGIGMAGKLRT